MRRWDAALAVGREADEAKRPLLLRAGMRRWDAALRGSGSVDAVLAPSALLAALNIWIGTELVLNFYQISMNLLRYLLFPV